MKRWMPLLSVALLLSVAVVASACPMCKDSIPNATGPGGGAAPPSGGSPVTGGSLPHGFNTSVYSMLIGFFTVLGMIIGIIVRGVRTSVANTSIVAGAQSQHGFPVVAPATSPQS